MRSTTDPGEFDRADTADGDGAAPTPARGLSRRTLLTGVGAATMAGVMSHATATASPVPSQNALPEIDWPTGVRRPADLATIVDWDAAELSVAIRRRLVTCVEVMTAYLDHIDALNPKVNAIVSRRPRADLLAEAAGKDDLIRKRKYQGWMHGFPHAVKDLADVKGIETTYGFFQGPYDLGPATADSMFVERIRAAGAIFIGKTNTPEFGLGSQTYNTVFGTTLNAYDQRKTSGGSSGGAAVAVALRMVPVADGSDFMGSLRNPPGWNNVLGLRPSVGRVADDGELFVSQAGVVGPIARTALDLALLMRTMSGYDPRAPLSIEQDPAPLTDLKGRFRGKRIAWFGDLGGYLPMESDVLSVTTAALRDFRAIGMTVDKLDALPTASGFAGNNDLWPTWLTYRHWLEAGTLEGTVNYGLYDQMKPEARYEYDGLVTGANGNGPISGMDVYHMSKKRTGLYNAFLKLFDTYDYAVFPTAQVMPFDATTHWPTQVDGVHMSSYHRWMEVTTVGTMLNAPTLALPAGFNSAGLPIGLQVIGRNHDDFSLLDLAHAWELRTRWVQRTPPPLLARRHRS